MKTTKYSKYRVKQHSNRFTLLQLFFFYSFLQFYYQGISSGIRTGIPPVTLAELGHPVSL